MVGDVEDEECIVACTHGLCTDLIKLAQFRMRFLLGHARLVLQHLSMKAQFGYGTRFRHVGE